MEVIVWKDLFCVIQLLEVQVQGWVLISLKYEKKSFVDKIISRFY